MIMIKLVGSRFTKITATKNPSFQGKIAISSHAKILALEPLKDMKDTLDAKYAFEVLFGELGTVQIEGSVYVRSEGKIIKELQKSWEAKKFDSPENLFLTNLIIQKASLKALLLEEEVGLPTHIRLPSLQAKK